MNILTSWFAPSTLHALGWTLLHFLWQGTALAALTAVVMTLCRRAQTRYAMAVGALVVMLAAPVVTLYVLTRVGSAAPLDSYQAPQAYATTVGNIAATQTQVQPSRLRDALPGLVEVWLLGVVFFSLRSVGGFVLLERERRKLTRPVSERLLAMSRDLQRRMGLQRTIRYVESQCLQGPAVIGWFRPIVVLPVTALTGLSEDQLRAILAHELAHIQRFDAFVNAFQIAVETLLFYHPAVWWLNRCIRTEREHCCDDAAVTVCGDPVEYARALTLLEGSRSSPALAMAANRGSLSERIFRLLGLKSDARRGMGLAGGILCLAAALAAGNAVLEIAYPAARARAASMTQLAVRHMPWQEQGSSKSSATPARPAKPSAGRAQATPQSSPQGSGSYIDNMKAAGVEDVTVDQLIALKIQGVTPEYVRALHEQGVTPDADELIAMKIQGVTPEYVRDLHGLGLKPNADELVAMRIQGADAAYVREMKEAGVQADVDQLVAMKIQGVTPEYVRGLRAQGLEPNADELVAMKIQKVTSDFVRDIHGLGLKPTVDQVVAMQIQGVTAEYVKNLQNAGLTFSVDDVIGAKIQGITEDFVDKAVKHGFKNLTLEKLIEIKRVGILDSQADL